MFRGERRAGCAKPSPKGAVRLGVPGRGQMHGGASAASVRSCCDVLQAARGRRWELQPCNRTRAIVWCPVDETREGFSTSHRLGLSPWHECVATAGRNTLAGSPAARVREATSHGQWRPPLGSILSGRAARPRPESVPRRRPREGTTRRRAHNPLKKSGGEGGHLDSVLTCRAPRTAGWRADTLAPSRKRAFVLRRLASGSGPPMGASTVRPDSGHRLAP